MDSKQCIHFSHKQKKNQKRNDKRRLTRQKSAKQRENQDILSDEEQYVELELRVVIKITVF